MRLLAWMIWAGMVMATAAEADRQYQAGKISLVGGTFTVLIAPAVVSYAATQALLGTKP